MKTIFILLIIPLLSFSQVEIENLVPENLDSFKIKVKNFDSAFFKVKEINLTDTKETNTKVTIYEEHISVRFLDGLFIFQIVTTVPNDRNVIILLVNSKSENNIIVVYDKNNTAISFEYKDRIIMFFNKNKLEKYIIPDRIKQKFKI